MLGFTNTRRVKRDLKDRFGQAVDDIVSSFDPVHIQAFINREPVYGIGLLFGTLLHFAA